MPSLVKIRVVEGKDLPVMDKNLQGEAYVDSYVDIKLRQQQQRTQTIRKTLNPVWDEEFRFEVVDDSVLQNTPVEFKVMDQDVYSSDVIGVAYVDLNPLIMRTAHGSDKDLVIQGWFPLYDTLRGIRGSLHIIIKLQFIGNDNPFRDSSAGVQFFSVSSLSPAVFVIQEVLGFVEDLVVEDDPEMSWHDYFRLAKSSNDSRMRVLYNLSATVRRELGKRVIEAGGNAVLGYSSHFDVEGASGIVARAHGTACRLLKVEDIPSNLPSVSSIVASSSTNALMPPHTARAVSAPSGLSLPLDQIHTDSAHSLTSISQVLTTPDAVPSRRPTRQPSILIPFGPLADKQPTARPANPTDNSSSRNLVSRRHAGSADFGALQVGADGAPHLLQSEVQILSLKQFEWPLVVRYGGLVMSKSVKFLGKLASTLSDQETRESWWEELRDDIKNHASTLCCTHIVGYSESCTIFGDVCVLSATGTAAVVKDMTPIDILGMPYFTPARHDAAPSSPATSRRRSGSDGTIERMLQQEEERDKVPPPAPDQSPPLVRLHSHNSYLTTPRRPDPSYTALPKPSRRKHRPCYCVHVPYNRNRAPFAFMRLVPCLNCGRKWVPECLILTTQPPDSLPIRGHGRLLESVVCRTRKPGVGEADAVKISEVLPFVEFDIQRQLMLKLKVLGMNAAVGYTSKIQFSGTMIIATATCTAVYIESLPPPAPLQIARTLKETGMEQDAHLRNVHSKIESLYQINKQYLDEAASIASPRPLSTSYSAHSRSLTSMPQPSPRDPVMSQDAKDESSSSSSSSDSDSSDTSDEGSSLENPTSSSSSESSDEEETKASTAEEAQSRMGTSSRKSRRNSFDSGDENINTARQMKNKFPRKGQKLKTLFEDDRRPYVLEVDEETDLDLMAVLVDRVAPPGLDFVNTESVPGLGSNKCVPMKVQHMKVVRRVKLLPSRHAGGLSNLVAQLFQSTYARLCFAARKSLPCQIVGLTHTVIMLEEDTVELIVSAMCHSVLRASSTELINTTASIAWGPRTIIPVSPFVTEKYLKSLPERASPTPVESSTIATAVPADPAALILSRSSPVFKSFAANVVLTSLSAIPGAEIKRYLGPIQLHFIKESWAVRGEGLLGSFFYVFLSEVDAAARAQVVALGGNALLSYRIVPVESGSRVSRNQAYNMISVYGDAVLVDYNQEEAATDGIDGALARSRSHSS